MRVKDNIWAADLAKMGPYLLFIAVLIIIGYDRCFHQICLT